ncbi:transcriptional repressor LexA [Candidatus Gracilibacteria bacterium]|nr:transcriptional repressor LexA [Candidatus Gracilibacteria bacterium]
MDQVLTEKQEAVLKFIEEYQLAYGKSPTLREMREHFGVSSDNSILKHLSALKEKGYIQKDDTPRGIGLLNSVKEKLDEGAFSLPILGFVPAGGPVVTDEYVEGWMKVGEELAKNNTDYFFLKVTGLSMIDAGIVEGDLVLVNIKKQPREGDIVVALIDEGNTLKRLVKENGKFYLKAENKNYKDIYPKESLTIQGVVTGLIRQY